MKIDLTTPNTFTLLYGINPLRRRERQRAEASVGASRHQSNAAVKSVQFACGPEKKKRRRMDLQRLVSHCHNRSLLIFVKPQLKTSPLISIFIELSLLSLIFHMETQALTRNYSLEFDPYIRTTTVSAEFRGHRASMCFTY